MIPVPLMVCVNPGVTVTVKALAPRLNTRLSIVAFAVSERAVVADVLKVATSAAAFGGPPADQLPAVDQVPLAGAASHVALAAKAGLAASIAARAKRAEKIRCDRLGVRSSMSGAVFCNCSGGILKQEAP